ncbi:hypothetical protein IWQ62_001215 [Dispira parvispora]|uniref:OPA3-like protein n=1 Tax=Dispira parvispora TaxID=1520584 RepID=A0A9W8AZK0_9FUNG|nr:hypothetical protein IWQ62_001215 [Dispira parvispora]
MCIGLAQTGHRVDMNLKMKFFGYRKEHIRPLNDAKAIEAGANFLSEAIIFSVAGSIILFENQRSKYAARERRNLVDDTLSELEEENARLQDRLTEYRSDNQRLTSQVEDLRQDVDAIRAVLHDYLSKEITTMHQEIAHS